MIYLFAAMLAAAQTAPAMPPAPAPAASTAKFNLDTPIETLVADPAAKAVLAADLHTDIATVPSYDMFKSMSLNQIAGYAPDKMPPALMTKIATDLAAIK